MNYSEVERLIMRLRRQGASKVEVSDNGVSATWLDPYVAPVRPRKPGHTNGVFADGTVRESAPKKPKKNTDRSKTLLPTVSVPLETSEPLMGIELEKQKVRQEAADLID